MRSTMKLKRVTVGKGVSNCSPMLTKKVYATPTSIGFREPTYLAFGSITHTCVSSFSFNLTHRLTFNY
jgi:hypothetical protein